MQTKLAIYQRLKTPKGWRYQRVKEGKGKHTAGLVPPFYIRPTVNETQNWVRLEAESFSEARQEAEQFDPVLAAAAQGLTVKQTEDIANRNRTAVADAVATYLEQKRHKAPKTLAAYRHHLSQFIESLRVQGIRFVDEITVDSLRAYKDFLVANGYAGKTVDTRITNVYFLLKKNGVTARLPKDEMPIVEVEAAVPYTQEELDRLFAAMNDEQRIRYKFFLGTGARDREVTFASWADIDFGKKEYHVRQKPDVGFFPKSHESRTIPLPSSLVEALRARRKAHPNDRWLFVNAEGRPENHFLHKLKTIALRAGLNCGNCQTSRNKWKNGKVRVREVTCKTAPVCEHIFLHRFRKTRATQWAEAGIPLRTIQAWLGHKDLTTTQRYLGVTSSEKLRAHIDSSFGD